jgi:hypothetical protein
MANLSMDFLSPGSRVFRGFVLYGEMEDGERKIENWRWASQSFEFRVARFGLKESEVLGSGWKQ